MAKHVEQNKWANSNTVNYTLLYFIVPLTSGPCDDRGCKEWKGHEKFTSQTCAALWKEIIISIILLLQDMDERMNTSMCNNLHYAKAMYHFSMYHSIVDVLDCILSPVWWFLLLHRMGHSSHHMYEFLIVIIIITIEWDKARLPAALTNPFVKHCFVGVTFISGA